MLPHLPKAMLPAWSLCCALYLEGGIRGGAIGEVTFGSTASNTPLNNDDINNDNDNEIRPELLRLAIPRRTYTESHMRYVADVLGEIVKNKHDLVGYEITWEPKVLRHFSAHLAPVPTDRCQQKARTASFGRKVATGDVLPDQLTRSRASSIID